MVLKILIFRLSAPQTASGTWKRQQVRGEAISEYDVQNWIFMIEFSGNDKSAGKERRKMGHKGMSREQVLTCFLWLFMQFIKQEEALNSGSAQNGSHL